MTIAMESLQSDAVAHKLLVKVHQTGSPNPAVVYRIAAKIGACARQAAAFERAAETTELTTRPMLEYYAMLHWMKVLLHLRVLDYPPSSAVLQHGMSCRRIKRDNYRWPLESVYLYKQGVLQSFYELTWQMDPDLVRPAGQARAHTDAQAHSKAHAQAEGPLPLPGKLVIGTLLGQMPALEGALNMFYPQFVEMAGNDDGGTPAPMAGPTSEWFVRFVLLFSLSGLVRYNPVEWSDIVLWSNESDSYLIREFLAQPRFRFNLNAFVEA